MSQLKLETTKNRAVGLFLKIILKRDQLHSIYLLKTLQNMTKIGKM